MVSELINHAYVIKPPKKLKGWGLESLRLGEHVETGERDELGGDAEAPLSFPTPCPTHVFHLAIPELIFFNQPVI